MSGQSNKRSQFSKQNSEQRIYTLKSKISNVHNLIAQTRQIIQPSSIPIERNHNNENVCQTIKINNFTNAKVKINIIIPEQQEVDKVFVNKKTQSIGKKLLNQQQSLHQNNQNKKNQFIYKEREVVSSRINIDSNYIYQNEISKTNLIIKQRVQKSFKKINPSSSHEIQQNKTTTIEPLKQIQIEQEKNNLKNTQKFSNVFDKLIIKQQNSRIKQNVNLHDLNQSDLAEMSAIKVLNQLESSNQNIRLNCEQNFEMSNQENTICKNNDNSYAQSQIKQENIHNQNFSDQIQESRHSILQLSQSRGFKFRQSYTNDFFQLTSQKKQYNDKTTNKKMQLVIGDQGLLEVDENQRTPQVNENQNKYLRSPQVASYGLKNQIYQTPIVQQQILSKRILFKNINHQDKQQKSRTIKDQFQKQQNLAKKIQLNTPVIEDQYKSLKDTLNSKEKSTNQKTQRNFASSEIKKQQKNIILPENKRLKKYAQLQKYRKIKIKSQQSHDIKNKSFQSKVVYINLADKKAEDLFLTHKRKFLQKLKKKQKSNYGTKYHLNQSRNYSNAQSIQRTNKRSLSPQCQQITNRLYNSRTGAYPCSYYQKFHQELQRQRFQQMVKQYPTVIKYLSQKERTDFYIHMKKNGLPQSQWIANLLKYTNKKMKFYTKK